MQLKDRKDEFPKMPMEIRTMIEKEVEKQMHNNVVVPIKRKTFPKRKVIVAILAASLTLGTTVFAAVQYYKMTVEKIGEYGAETRIDLIEEGIERNEVVIENETDMLSPVEKAVVEVPEVVCEVGYVPEGMVQFEEQKYRDERGHYVNNGFSFVFYAMDLGDDAFEMFDEDIAYQEELVIGGREVIYLEKVAAENGMNPFKKMYVFYPEVHYVMELFIDSGTPKEEAVKFVEGITLRLATEADDKKSIVKDWTWSRYIESITEVYEPVDTTDDYRMLKKDFVTREIGETVHAGDLTACVEKVEVFDDINVLSPEYMDRDMLLYMKVIDKEGNLLEGEKTYYKRGNGVDTVDELLKTESVPLKLVYVTVAYTNNGNEDLEEAIFNGALLKVVEEGEELVIWDKKQNDENIERGYTEWFDGEMFYYDVHGGERNNNYIPSIKAGETVKVHMGFIVEEEVLPMMYLNLDNYSSQLQFSETALEIGYIDIRQ